MSSLPRSLDSLSAMYVAELAQAEPVSSWGVHIAVHSHGGAGGGHLECLPDLNVHLKVGDGAPVVRSWNRGESLMPKVVCHGNMKLLRLQVYLSLVFKL